MARSGFSRGAFGCLSPALRFELPIYGNPLWQPHPLQGRSGWMVCSRAVAETPFGRREAKLVVAIDDEGDALSPRRLESLLGKPFTAFEESAEEPLIELEEAADGLRRDFLQLCEGEHIALIEQREEEVERQAARMGKDASQALLQGERLLARWRRDLRAGGLDEASALRLRADIARMEDALLDGQRSVRERMSSLRDAASAFEASVLATLPLEAEVEHLWTARWTTEPCSDDWDRSGAHDNVTANAFADELRDGGHWFGTERRRKRAPRAVKAFAAPAAPDRRAAALREFAQATKERTNLRASNGMPRWAPPPFASPARDAFAGSIPSVTLVIHETGGQRACPRALPPDDGALQGGKGREPNVSIARKRKLEEAQADVFRALWACNGLSFAAEEQNEALQLARMRLKAAESQWEPRPASKGLPSRTRHVPAPAANTPRFGAEGEAPFAAALSAGNGDGARAIPHDVAAPDAQMPPLRGSPEAAAEAEKRRLALEALLAAALGADPPPSQADRSSPPAREGAFGTSGEAVAIVMPPDVRDGVFKPDEPAAVAVDTFEPPSFASGLPMEAREIVWQPAAAVAAPAVPPPAGADDRFGSSPAQAPPAGPLALHCPERHPEPPFPAAAATPIDRQAAGAAEEDAFWDAFEHDLLAAMDVSEAGVCDADGFRENAPPAAFALEQPRVSSSVHWFEEAAPTANPVLDSILANLKPRAMPAGPAGTAPVAAAFGNGSAARPADPGASPDAPACAPAPRAPAERAPEKRWNAGALAAARARAKLVAEQRGGGN